VHLSADGSATICHQPINLSDVAALCLRQKSQVPRYLTGILTSPGAR